MSQHYFPVTTYTTYSLQEAFMHVDTFSWWLHLFRLNLDICFVAPELLQCCLFTFESVSGRLPINITQEAQLSPRDRAIRRVN